MAVMCSLRRVELGDHDRNHAGDIRWSEQRIRATSAERPRKELFFLSRWVGGALAHEARLPKWKRVQSLEWPLGHVRLISFLDLVCAALIYFYLLAFQFRPLGACFKSVSCKKKVIFLSDGQRNSANISPYPPPSTIRDWITKKAFLFRGLSQNTKMRVVSAGKPSFFFLSDFWLFLRGWAKYHSANEAVSLRQATSHEGPELEG